MCIPEKIIICKGIVHLLSYYSVELRPYIYSLERSITKLNEIPNPVHRIWYCLQLCNRTSERACVAPSGSTEVHLNEPGTIYPACAFGFSIFI